MQRIPNEPTEPIPAELHDDALGDQDTFVDEEYEQALAEDYEEWVEMDADSWPTS